MPRHRQKKWGKEKERSEEREKHDLTLGDISSRAPTRVAYTRRERRKSNGCRINLLLDGELKKGKTGKRETVKTFIRVELKAQLTALFNPYLGRANKSVYTHSRSLEICQFQNRYE